MKSLSVFTTIAIALMVGPAAGQEPMVRTSLADQGDFWVGQRVVLVVELLAPGIFSGAASFDLPDPNGMLLIPPVSRPTLGSEEINGVSYTVQRHELSVISRRAGEQSIPPVTIRFRFKRHPLDKDSVEASVRTETVKLSVKAPPGAEKFGGIISARDLKAVETWTPEPGKAKAGDAFTRAIVFSAEDVPAMAFPPFIATAIDGIGIYRKAPEVVDQSERGSLRGERRETVTYVCKRAGQFVIPAARFSWFDLDAKQVRIIEFPARSLNVAANPAMATAANSQAAAAEGSFAPSWRQIVVVVAVIGLVIVGYLSRRRWLAPFMPVKLVPLNPIGD